MNYVDREHFGHPFGENRPSADSQPSFLSEAQQPPFPPEGLVALDIFGGAAKFCDGISRRSFLKVGAFSYGAAQLPLADVLRAESGSSKLSRQKSIINIFLGGGPHHQDTWDLKPDAPVEIRAEFSPIPTNLAGIRIGEMFPKIASMMDRFAVVRSIVGARGGHDAVQCMTGMPDNAFRALGGWPSMGAILSKLKGPVDPSVPPFVGLAAHAGHMPWADVGKPGFLGAVRGHFSASGYRDAPVAATDL